MTAECPSVPCSRTGTDVEAGPHAQAHVAAPLSQAAVPLGQYVLQCVEQLADYGGEVAGVEPDAETVAGVVRE